ncbi:hypothetical protein M3J09_010563 [Ascochyta lentis]
MFFNNARAGSLSIYPRVPPHRIQSSAVRLHRFVLCGMTCIWASTM